MANYPLTILVIGRFNDEAFALHIAETLESVGHAVLRFEAGINGNGAGANAGRLLRSAHRAIHELARGVPMLRKHHTNRLLRRAGERHIDLTLCCHDFLLPAEVRSIKEATGSPVALWFPDAIINFGRCFFLNSEYDALFFKDPYIVHRLRDHLEKPVYYLPECHSPRRCHQVALSPTDQRVYGCDITTAGNTHSYRTEFFSGLGDYDVKIWGYPPPLWMDTRSIERMLQRRFVGCENKARAFLGAKIVLNNLHPAEIWGINCRAFEIAGIGAFQLLDWRPGLPQLFNDGSELVSFRGAADLREKIDYYLAHPSERAAIARRGLERARREHTYEVRLSCLLDTVLADGAGFPMPEIEAF